MTSREAPFIVACSTLGIAALLASISTSRAGDTPERSRDTCDFKSEGSGCPGPTCRCIQGSLEITLGGESGSIFEYESFQDGLEIEASVVSDVDFASIDAWSFGVTHDPDALELVEVRQSPFCDFSFFVGECSAPAELSWGSGGECSREPVSAGSGWVSVGMLRPNLLRELPSGRCVLGRAVYRLRKDTGEEGTLIHTTECLGKKGWLMPTGLFAQAGGKTKLWTTMVDGWVKKRGTAPPFLRGDLDGNGKINILDGLLSVQIQSGNLQPPYECPDALDANDDGKLDGSDAVAILRFVFERRPEIAPPFPACEPDPTPDGVQCMESNCARPR